tara:strand:+ start:410 stop:1303 length:894 start_codon:yes stop_codon:yes gene_type:complete
MAETQGTGAMALYNANSGEAGFGQAMASELAGREMAQRQKMAPPIGGQSMSRPDGAPEWYNYSGMPSAKYAVPNEAKERLLYEAAARRAAADVGDPSVPRPAPITDTEVNYIEAMDKQQRLAKFDRFVSKLCNPRKPGNLKWLMEVYPEFVNRRVAQVHDDYDFAIRKQMIDNWGVNTFDDLHFLFLCDQGLIDGPSLSKRTDKAAMYESSWLSPLNFYQPRKAGMNLPYASSTVKGEGMGPADRDDWVESGAGQPIAGGSDLNTLAREVMDLNPNRRGDLTGQVADTARRSRFLDY